MKNPSFTGSSRLPRSDEIEASPNYLGLSVEEFRAMYTRDLETGEVSPRERHNSDCIFYDRKEGGGIAVPLISGSVGITYEA